jgi:hypothetical protein
MNDGEAEVKEDILTPLEEVIDDYWSTYRQHVHILLAWGYADSRMKVLSSHEEPDITGFVAEAIQNRLNALDSPLWCDQITLSEDPPIPGGMRTGRKRWRPDLVFESVDGRRPRARYHFEAKRLRRSGSEKDYLGGEGLGCFLVGMYASECNEAGMLGYVQSDDLTIWAGKLRMAIDQDFQNGNVMFLLSPQQDVSIIDAFPYEWISEHKRQNGQTITVHHILLDYLIVALSHPIVAV